MMRKIRFSNPVTTHTNPFMEIRQTHADFGSFTKDYFVIELGPRVGIVAIKEDCILLTRQYRFLIDRLSWEIPGGRVDEGETPETAGVRECLEETGIECCGLRKLVEYYPGLDNFNNRTTVFLSEQTRALREFSGVASEVTEIRWVPLPEALRMVFDGEILDALTVTGLLAYKAVSI
jgi:ADP-ribose diphosphatase